MVEPITGISSHETWFDRISTGLPVTGAPSTRTRTRKILLSSLKYQAPMARRPGSLSFSMHHSVPIRTEVAIMKHATTK